MTIVRSDKGGTPGRRKELCVLRLIYGRRETRTPDLLGVKRIMIFPNLSRTFPRLPSFDTMPCRRSRSYHIWGKIDLKW